ncbi:hypothetical protein [uncultured Caulobacter sp.]|uniref:hypothetical protein n=1 Tax=uncultured Caulobacter sp. TaxID=158749 RepID=UPI00262BE9D7|nr:hypothetical protein [uncultured Caulobacter sp.]
MHYASGETVELGDHILMEGGARGQVVALIEAGAYAAAYAAADWSYLREGALVEAEDAGLMHYREPDQAWALVSRKT